MYPTLFRVQMCAQDDNLENGINFTRWIVAKGEQDAARDMLAMIETAHCNAETRMLSRQEAKSYTRQKLMSADITQLDIWILFKEVARIGDVVCSEVEADEMDSIVICTSSRPCRRFVNRPLREVLTELTRV